MTHLQTHDDQVAIASQLAGAHSIPAVRECLKSALDLDDNLWDGDKEAALDLLEHVVAFALSERGDRARQWGAFSERESIANRLGLGALERPGGGA